MRRSIVLAVVAAALAAVAVPAFAASTVSVPPKYAGHYDQIRSKSRVAVLLPSTIKAPVSSSKVFGTIEGLAHGRYHLALGVGQDCHEATACFIASFFAFRGQHLSLPQRVRLAHGIHGRFDRIHCGASCAPAQIEWRRRRVRYEIDYKGDKAQLVALANSAIRHGPR